MKNVRKKLSVVLSIIFCALLAGAVNAKEYKKPGLLVLSHGSSNTAVNDKVEAMVAQMRAENGGGKAFHAVENAFLEAGSPTAKTGIERLQASGCDLIVVIPFFTSQDEHTQRDIPTVMGLAADPHALAELKEEGIELAAPKVPVLITKTLNETTLLADFAKSEAAAMSKEAKDEAFIVISLEKNEYENLVVPSISAAARQAAQSKGIRNYKDVYSWQDETFCSNAIPQIKDFSAKNKRVLVTSVYTTRSAQSLYDNAAKAAAAKGIDIKEGFGAAEIIYSQNSLIDYKDTAKIILKFAETYIMNK